MGATTGFPKLMQLSLYRKGLRANAAGYFARLPGPPELRVKSASLVPPAGTS
jgi:hypothetical protein